MKELNEKIRGLDDLYGQRLQLMQQKADKEFELIQLNEQAVINANGGSTNWVENLTLGLSTWEIAVDSISSSLLNLPLRATASANASYVTTESRECEWYENVNGGTVTHKELYDVFFLKVF